MNNSPNPFSASTKIDYYVPARQIVQLTLFNAEGKTLRSLVDAPQKMGEYSVIWDGKTDKGEKMASGPYYYQLRIRDFISSKKMILLK
jgi:flagellar hook assembly protein FlgD